MKLVAIDPGTTKSGWVQIEDGIPVQHGWYENEPLLKILELDVYSTDLAIEDITSFGMPVGKDVFTTVRWTGRFDHAASQNGLPATYIGRKEVMTELCGTPRGNDSTLRQAIIDRFGGEEIAIGGKKCKTCKGKGWTGRDHNDCPDCHCGGHTINRIGEDFGKTAPKCGYQTHPGVLHGISGHVWSALGVGLTYIARL